MEGLARTVMPCMLVRAVAELLLPAASQGRLPVAAAAAADNRPLCRSQPPHWVAGLPPVAGVSRCRIAVAASHYCQPLTLCVPPSVR
eukprot:13135218-Alexandrium_andersonii.AAC.1